MERSRRLAPLLGIVVCLVVLGVLAAPYALTDGTTVGLYYDSGVVNPLVVGVLVLVSIIVFAAGREGRADPALAAGVTLTLGLFVAASITAWALTVRVDVAGATLANHRWLLTGAAIAVPATAAWYVRALGLV